MEVESGLLETSSMMSMPRQTLNILCCMCGISFNPSQTKTNICSTCLANKQDVTVGITKQAILNFCRTCRRYNRPPWVYMERESKELLAFCLKKIKGLNTVKLIDAQFIWTEPHSRRIKLKLVIQKEVINNASIQQTFEVEFYEHYMQCDDCKKEFTPHTWSAQVQVRQRVAHKRTFYYLEQLILKNNVHTHLLKVEEKDEGLDFFFKNKSHALRLVEYLQTVLPMKVKPSKQLISYDEQNSIYNTKYSWSAEIPRICKDDLVILPPKLAKELGGVCPIQLCLKLTTTIRLLDPRTMKRIELTPDRYFHYEQDLQIITLKQNSEEFQINDCDKVNDDNLNESYQTSISNLYINKIYNLDVSRMSDWQQFQVKTHLGSAIKVGAILQGYDLTKINYEEVDKLKNIPEIIIVKRVYDKNKRKNRIWQLNRLEQEGIMVEEAEDRLRKKKSKALKGNDEDFEEFMDDIEVNPEIQKNIRMYKNQENIKKLTAKQIERRSKQKKDKQRKIVVVKNVRKLNNNNVNIFNEPIQEADEFDDKQSNQGGLEERDFKQPKNKKIGVKQKYKKTQEEEKKQESVTNDDDSESEEDEVKLYQLEDIFNKFNIDDDEEEAENQEEQNQKVIDEFVKGMESFKIDNKK